MCPEGPGSTAPNNGTQQRHPTAGGPLQWPCCHPLAAVNHKPAHSNSLHWSNKEREGGGVREELLEGGGGARPPPGRRGQVLTLPCQQIIARSSQHQQGSEGVRAGIGGGALPPPVPCPPPCPQGVATGGVARSRATRLPKSMCRMHRLSPTSILPPRRQFNFGSSAQRQCF